MKKLLCVLLACAMGATAAIGFSGCGCDDGTRTTSSQAGYKVEPTEPDITSGDFGFFIINQDELMLTKYTGSSKDVVIPDSYDNYSVTVIGASVFNGTDIESVTIPSTIEEIEDHAFSSCHSLTTVNLSEGLRLIDTCVFFNCSALKEITLPSTLEKIGTKAFSGSSVNNVVLPANDKLVELEQYIFYQARELTDITISPCVTKIADDVFDDTANEVTIHGVSGTYAEAYAKSKGMNFETTDIYSSSNSEATTEGAE